MNENYVNVIAAEQDLRPEQVLAVLELLADGATVPFIARYRKEATGSLDEVVITAIRDRQAQMLELDERKAAVLKSLEKHGHLNEELEARVMAAETLAVLEDIYLPYRPKRRTRAAKAREKGLEPLALALFAQNGTDPQQAAEAFIDPENEVATIEDALAGARDIIAEMVSEDQTARGRLRDLFRDKSVIQSRVVTGVEEAAAKFKDYFDWQEPALSAPSHRILAMRRGEKEDLLNLSILPPEENALQILEDLFVKGGGPDAIEVRQAVHDSYKRLLSRAMETEMRILTKETADTEAIRVFSENLRQLLLAAPLGAKQVMGIDPGFRTGCKVVCLDSQGKFLHQDTIYPHSSAAKKEDAAQKVLGLCQQFGIQAIAIGNGTAGRETEAFVRALPLASSVQVVMVNESGASIYSASEAARDEFPDLDLTLRGAISIGRRLMDPLAELVKIDPKSIGVGQYQHDVDQSLLKQALDDVVTSCVNNVGVDVNRASVQLLTYVSGLGPMLARNIVSFRDTNGPFSSRDDLQKVTRLGPKAFEQCAGFLRIPEGDNPLDASAVHPESYPIVDRMARNLDCKVGDLIKEATLRAKIQLQDYVTKTVGLPTLNDILAELAKPGRDPRERFEAFAFAENVEKMEDLEPGMRIPGIVTNVTQFGAFIDIGVHQDGLAHISELADRFVKDPAEVVKVHQQVMVTVLEVDLARRRISLSLRGQAAEKPKSGKPAPQKSARPATRPKSGKKPPKKPQNDRNRPFHNPFADLLGGR